MCATCTTVFDAMVTNAVLGSVWVSNRWVRRRDRKQGIEVLERDQCTWEENAAFVRSMGLDPLGTLGAPPTVPHVDVEVVAEAGATVRTADPVELAGRGSAPVTARR